MKAIRKILVLLLCAAFTFDASLPAFTGAVRSTELTDYFGDACFSDGTVNRFLAWFPRVCGILSGMSEASAVYFSGENRRQKAASGSVTVEFDFDMGCDGALGTIGFDRFFGELGLYLYPNTLGGYLSSLGYAEIGGVLAAAGKDWPSLADADGAYAFSFDWGVDACPTAEARYERFIGVVGDLLDAAPALFNAVLGNEPQTLVFEDRPLYCADATNISCAVSGYTMMTLKKGFSITGVSGVWTFSPMRVYADAILPAYRCIGVNDVLALTPGALPLNAAGREKADAILHPLYELTRAVRSEPEACRRLADHYAFDRADAAPQLPDWNASLKTTKCALHSDNCLINSILGALESTLAEKLSTDVSFPASLVPPTEEIETLWETVPTLTYTEPEQPDVPEETLPEETVPAETAPEEALRTSDETQPNSPFSSLFSALFRWFGRLKELFQRMF